MDCCAAQAVLQPLFVMGSSLHLAVEEPVGYSKLSLYFSLALYLATLPGLFSLVSRSTKVKSTRIVYNVPATTPPKPLRQVAAEVVAYFRAQNYLETATEDAIVFRGQIARSKSQAAFLTFCSFVALASLGLVVSVLLPAVGSGAYLLVLLSPYAGYYYWTRAQQAGEISVVMSTAEPADDKVPQESAVVSTSVVATGDREQLERFARALGLAERGKIYVKGILE